MITPDELQKRLLLGKILTPEAQRIREAAYLRQKITPGPDSHIRFVHYTTADAAIKIMRSKRLWMRNSTCMADYREVNHGFDMLKRYFDAGTNRAEFFAAFDAIAPGVAKNAIDDFDIRWRDHKLALNVFISSVSEHSVDEDAHGRLSMWRAFGVSAPLRVALVIKLPFYSGAIENMGVLFSPVSYYREGQLVATMDEIKSNIAANAEFLKSIAPSEIQNWIFGMIFGAVTCTKHEGFAEEREWRAIYCPTVFGSSPLIEPEVQIVGGIPQHVQKFPLDGSVDAQLAPLDLTTILDRVIIGPSSYPWVAYNVFADEISKLGVKGAIAQVSGIPLRS